MQRVPPSARTTEAIRKVTEEGTEQDPKAALVKLGIQRVIEEALEAAVRDTVGRDYYERRPVGAQGYRNGIRPGRLATSEGEFRYAVPQVRDVPPDLVRALRRRGIPEPVGGGIVMLGLVGTLIAGAWYLSGPAAEWIARAPESAAAVQRKLQAMRGSVEQVTRAAEQVEKATEVTQGGGAPQVEIKGPSLSKQLFGGTASFLSGATVVLFLTYFLLAVGDLFLQKLVAVLPQFKDKKTAVAIARETEAQISVYLFTSTLINIGVGVVTAIAMWLVGMPNAALWGVVAVAFALFARMAENLIEAINILGSIFYGVLLGLFLVAFFLRHVGGTAVFFAAVAAEALVIVMYFSLNIGYLWYNLIGCAACVILSLALQALLPRTARRRTP